MKTKFNKYGELEDLASEDCELSVEELLKDVPVVNFYRDLGLKKPTLYEKVHTYFGKKLAPLTNLNNKIKRYFR